MESDRSQLVLFLGTKLGLCWPPKLPVLREPKNASPNCTGGNRKRTKPRTKPPNDRQRPAALTHPCSSGGTTARPGDARTRRRCGAAGARRWPRSPTTCHLHEERGEQVSGRRYISEGSARPGSGARRVLVPSPDAMVFGSRQERERGGQRWSVGLGWGAGGGGVDAVKIRMESGVWGWSAGVNSNSAAAR